jgi:ketosteroid isomerase-like protein
MTVSEQENTRLVQHAYERIKAGDMPSFLELLAPDVRWRLPEMENVPFAGTWRGREGVARFFATVAAVQDVVEFQPGQSVAQGDTVVVLGRFRMRIKSAHVEFSSDWAHVWTVRGGQVAQFYEYVDTAAVSRAYLAAQTGSRA